MRATLLTRRSFLGQLLGGLPSTTPPSPPVPLPTCRALCSASSNIVPIQSEHDFNTALAKAQGESSPAIFYYTAVWCGPCRLIAPVIGELSNKYPHVTTYKIDIDQEGLGKALMDMKVSAVPTFQFFHDGKKEVEIVGLDVEGLKDTMNKLYRL